MQSEIVVVRAESHPMEGVERPGPHQIYTNPQVSVEVRELDELSPHKIRVDMIYAGVCGTDVHAVQTNPRTGYIRCSAPLDIPSEGRIIGHEGVGKVLAVGAEVRHVKPGAIVTFESIIVCHFCDACRRGHFNQCHRAKLLGLEKDGVFGTVVDLPSLLTHDVSDLARSDTGLKAAACVEPAGVAYVACQNTQISGGDVVVIFGAGPIGLFTAMLCDSVFGASRVVIVEPVARRRELARKWCDEVYDVEEFFDELPSAKRGLACNVDVVVEASGDLSNVKRVFRCLSANSRVSLLARGGASLTLDSIDHMITNGIRLVGSRGHLGGAFADVLRLYRTGRMPLDAIVTDVVDGAEGLADLLNDPDRIVQEGCKVLADFSSTAEREERMHEPEQVGGPVDHAEELAPSSRRQEVERALLTPGRQV
ncbi:MAG: alcohol dehydrogenase catalytic domain-containing protein [Planctomycetes bacterium]|nr:alcohol dehydrogenase catalytic domain-containing protein [Planctomycetota bacterium]